MQESQKEVIDDLARRKRNSRSYLSSLPLEEKIAVLCELQEQTYGLLAAREGNGGRPIPKKWQKWHTARHG